MKERPRLLHLLLIGLGLALLAAAAWYYTNASEPVEGLPALAEPQTKVPSTREDCSAAGGVWNPCASACPPDAQVCTMNCVQKCEGIGDGKKVVEIYFPNSALDPKHLDCGKVFPVRRAIAPSTAPFGEAKERLAELLKGPTDEEKAAGYFTTIPDGVTLVDASEVGTQGGVARLVFSQELDAGVGGSCRVGAIRAQIETTAALPGLQASIVAQGKTEATTLQP
jgi:hypothetical protein